MRQFLQSALTLSGDEASFSRRRFHAGDPVARDRLENIGRAFISGYNQALNVDEPDALARQLELTELELRGFAFEGAAMALTLLDSISPFGQKRLKRFLAGPAANHIYMVHAGAGWAIARLLWFQRPLSKHLFRLDPLLRWLAIDGYGFHEGYFHWPNRIRDQRQPRGLTPYARRVFDQGLGRSLWFVECADVARIRNSIARFPFERQRDLWSGCGLAAAYAGVADRDALERLKESAGGWKAEVAQGAAFAAKARQLARNPTEHTELACNILCGMTASESANLTDVALINLPADTEALPAYEIWRQRIQLRFSGALAT